MKEYLNQLKDGTKLMFKEFFNKDTRKKQKANMLTFSRLIISFIIPTLMIMGAITTSPIILGIAVGTTAFGGITDILDGAIARKNEICSEYGKLLDQFVDKIFNGVIALSLSLFNPVFLAMIFGEGLIAGTNLLYKKKYKDLNITSTLIGKVKQVPLCISLVLGFLSIIIPSFPNITNGAILITVLFQIATTSSYIIQNSKEKEQLRTKKIQDYINELEKEENDKEKVKVLEKNNIEVNIDTKLSRKEQYARLRDILNNIISLKNNSQINNLDENEKGIQKIKK